MMTRFFDRPGQALAVFLGASVVVWTLQCSLLQNILGLDIIETISWGAKWQWGYFKHPPLSGWIGYLFSCLSGHADWSMYLAAQLCLVTGVWFVYKLAREFFDEYGAATAALLLYVLHYYNPSSMKFCSHFVVMALQPVMAYYFYLALRDNKMYQWLLLGLFTGLAVLGKYLGGILAVPFLVIMLSRADYRKRFLSPGPYLSGIVFLAVIAGHVKWLFEHDFSCLRHLVVRTTDCPVPWYYPLLVTVTVLYPFLAEFVALCLPFFLQFRNQVRSRINGPALFWGLTLTLIPSVFFILIALTGRDVVLMWLSMLASWSGIAVVAVFPLVITRVIFRRFYILMLVFTAALLIGTTIDLMIKPRLRLHTQPEVLTQSALDFWRKHGQGDIPVVLGERWCAGVIENYSPGRPPACSLDDPFDLRIHRREIDERGVLLIGFSTKQFRDFLNEVGQTGMVQFQKVSFEFRSLSGRTKKDEIILGYLPPKQEKKR